MRLCKTPILLTLTVAGLTACGPAGEAQDETLAEELVGAPVDDTHTFSVGVCAGALNAAGECRGGPVRCSGTLVAPNLVLTARHCIHTIEPDDVADPQFCDAHFTSTPLRAGGVRVTASPSALSNAPKWYEVTEAFVPADPDICDSDVAMLVLASNVSLAESYTARIDLERNLAIDPPKEVAIIGRGAVDLTFSLDPVTGDLFEVLTFNNGGLARRIIEHVPFLCASDVDFFCRVVDHSTPVTHEFALTKGQVLTGPALLNGDSGSGLFRQQEIDAKRPRVIGVASWGTWGPDGHTNASGFIRVDRHAPMLRNAAEVAASAGGYKLPSWARLDD
ncbi:MAG: trypsin-like serine protease [Deltaproteobacteria bacterium]|nr:trypsin-like serine protease [Deltaproteobacteria bacterium]